MFGMKSNDTQQKILELNQKMAEKEAENVQLKKKLQDAIQTGRKQKEVLDNIWNERERFLKENQRLKSEGVNGDSGEAKQLKTRNEILLKDNQKLHSDNVKLFQMNRTFAQNNEKLRLQLEKKKAGVDPIAVKVITKQLETTKQSLDTMEKSLELSEKNYRGVIRAMELMEFGFEELVRHLDRLKQGCGIQEFFDKFEQTILDMANGLEGFQGEANLALDKIMKLKLSLQKEESVSFTQPKNISSAESVDEKVTIEEEMDDDEDDWEDVHEPEYIPEEVKQADEERAIIKLTSGDVEEGSFMEDEPEDLNLTAAMQEMSKKRVSEKFSDMEQLSLTGMPEESKVSEEPKKKRGKKTQKRFDKTKKTTLI